MFWDPYRRILTGIILFAVVCVTAVVGYMLAGWDLADAIYMVIITMFGVGYGEVQPVQSPQLRALTIAVIVAGYGAVIYTFGGFVQMLMDGELKRALGAQRMSRGIEQMVGHTIICGGGRMGMMLAKRLQEASQSFVLVDTNSETVAQAEADGMYVVCGDATEETVLQRAGVERARLLCTVLSDDSANVFITLTAADLNPKVEILARAEAPSTHKKLVRSGASKVVMPAAIGAGRLADLVTRPSAEQLLEQSKMRSGLHDELGMIGLSMHELGVSPDSPMVGRPVDEMIVQGQRGFLVVALRQADGGMIINPPPDTNVGVGDTIILLGHADDIPTLSRRFVLQQEITYRGATLRA